MDCHSAPDPQKCVGTDWGRSRHDGMDNVWFAASMRPLLIYALRNGRRDARPEVQVQASHPQRTDCARAQISRLEGESIPC